MSDLLKDAIEQAKKEQQEQVTEEVVETPTEVENVTPESSVETEDDDDAIIISEHVNVAEQNEQMLVAAMNETSEEPKDGIDADIQNLKAQMLSQSPAASAAVQTVADSNATGYKSRTNDEWMKMIDEGISEINIPEDVVKIEAKNVFELIMNRREKLILQEDFEGFELDEILEKRLDKEIDALRTKYTGKGASVIIEVPESSADKIEFTEEQQQKLEKASKIQLVKVEKKDLKTLNVKKLKKSETKIKFIEKMNANFISTYSTPLPLTGEFCTFRGALLIELLQARAEKNEMLQDTITKKASLAYKHLIEGVNCKVKDEKGMLSMTYDNFTNRFRYHDLDLMIFAIACASSGPLTVSELTCQKCTGVFNHEFNIQDLLDMTNVPEPIKKVYDDIIQHHTSLKYIETLQEGQDELLRVESPITGNIYDLGAPSIARAVALLNSIDPDDPTDVYILALALFVHNMFIFDKDDDDYVEFSDEEADGNYDDFIAALKYMPQSELTMLHDQSTEMSYTPEFIMNSKCPHCGAKLVNNIPINDVVFFITPETPVETVSSKTGQKK